MNTPSSGQGTAVCAGATSKEPQKVVITLIHGTKFFYRWPWLVKTAGWLRWLCLCAPRFCKRLFRREAQEKANEPEWYREDSAFAKRLADAMENQCEITSFSWNGFNTEWDRLCAAGADADFRDSKKAQLGQDTLRAKIAKNAGDYPGCKQILIAHSHAGNLGLAALRDEETMKAVSGLVCLSTPFINVRRRFDSAALLLFFQLAVFIMLTAGLLGLIAWTQGFPKPWGSVASYCIIFFAMGSAGLFLGLSEGRRKIMSEWTSTERSPRAEVPIFLILADGDEALLALKITEILNSCVRGLWRLASDVPRRIFKLQRLFGDKWMISGPVFLILWAVGFWGMAYETRGALSTVLVLNLLWKSFVGIVGLFFFWCVVLALPAFLALLAGFAALAVFRWLSFGWVGSIDIEMTAEACPIGASAAYRLEDINGMRHCSYNHPDSTKHIAQFIRKVLGKD